MGLFTHKKPEPDKDAILAELITIKLAIEKLNIPVIADDYDAGYDTAIDEALEIISERTKFYSGK